MAFVEGPGRAVKSGSRAGAFSIIVFALAGIASVALELAAPLLGLEDERD